LCLEGFLEKTILNLKCGCFVFERKKSTHIFGWPLKEGSWSGRIMYCKESGQVDILKLWLSWKNTRGYS
jgi:hypothetical protein